MLLPRQGKFSRPVSLGSRIRRVPDRRASLTVDRNGLVKIAEARDTRGLIELLKDQYAAFVVPKTRGFAEQELSGGGDNATIKP